MAHRDSHDCLKTQEQQVYETSHAAGSATVRPEHEEDDHPHESNSKYMMLANAVAEHSLLPAVYYGEMSLISCMCDELDISMSSCKTIM
jgi:hypothetical protein